MMSQLAYETKVERLLNCLRYVKSGGRATEAVHAYKVPSTTMATLVSEKFVIATGATANRRYEIPEIDGMDETTIRLMVDAVWKPVANRPRIPYQRKEKPVVLPFEGEEPKFLPPTILEDISKDFAMLAAKLGVSLSGKTPAGMAQYIMKLEHENAGLRDVIKQKDKKISEMQSELGKVAKRMKAQADAYLRYANDEKQDKLEG